MLETLKHGDYAAQVNTKFRAVEADETLEFELVNVSELKSGGGQEMFSLMFVRRDETILPQKLYELDHDTLGRGIIFLVPVSKDENGIKYEAVFNRMKKD